MALETEELFLQKVGDELVWGEDPNPFPEDGALPLFCTSLHPGTATRRPMAPGAYYDVERTENVLRFFTGLKHTQGHKAGEEFILTREQNWLICEAFGWLRSDGTRLHRICFVEMGRGNGKSQIGAGIAGYLLLADGELNPEVVGVSATRPTARKYCLERLKSMISANPALDSLVDMYQYEVRRRKSSQWGGTYEATSSDVNSNWGGAPHGIIFDEVHAQPNRHLWDAMETAMGKRKQPMMWGFTTAGWDRASICYELHSTIEQISKGVIEDPNYLGIIWSAPEDADWTDPEVWRRANPMIGEAFEEQFIADKCRKAQNTPAFQNTFRTLYLSQWVGSESAFIDVNVWDACDGSPLPRPGKRQAYGGLDLSSTTDLSAFAVATRNGDKVEFHLKLYAPAEGIIERERRDKIPYRDWVKKGWLTLTEGATIDQEVIKRDVFRAMEEWDLKDVGYDRWNASKLVREMEEEGVKMVQVGQGYASMSAPSKDLLDLAADGNIHHGGNGALRTMINNTSAQTDPAGNIKPDKSKSSSRIDGVVACIMALDGLNRRGSAPRKSAYDEPDDETTENTESEIDEVEELPQFRRSAYE